MAAEHSRALQGQPPQVHLLLCKEFFHLSVEWKVFPSVTLSGCKGLLPKPTPCLAIKLWSSDTGTHIPEDSKNSLVILLSVIALCCEKNEDQFNMSDSLDESEKNEELLSSYSHLLGSHIYYSSALRSLLCDLHFLLFLTQSVNAESYFKLSNVLIYFKTIISLSFWPSILFFVLILFIGLSPFFFLLPLLF